MVSTFLLSTLAMGVVLVGVAVFMQRMRKWRHDKPDADESGFDAIASLVKSPRAWFAAYAVLMLVGAGSVYVIVGGAGVPDSLVDSGMLILGAVFGVALLVFVGAGTYAMVRGHDRSSSQAAGMGAAAVGFVLLAAVAVKLVLA